MTQFDFAVFYTEIDGLEVIRCRDLPELMSWPADGESKKDWARYAVFDTIAFRLDDQKEVPVASEPRLGEYVVELPAVKAAKIELSNALIRAGLSREEFARRGGFSAKVVKKMFDADWPSAMEDVTAGLQALKKMLK